MDLNVGRAGLDAKRHDFKIAIAIFDDWPALQRVIDDLATLCGSCPSATVLSRAMPGVPEDLHLPGDLTRLQFATNLHATCSPGIISDELAAWLSRRPHTLAHALRDWLPLDQSWKLESAIEHGRIVLVLEMRSEDDYGALCATLVQHSPHIVQLIEFSANFGRCMH